MENNEEINLFTPNGYTYELNSIPTDFGSYSTDVYLIMTNINVGKEVGSKGISLRYDSPEVGLIISLIKTYALKIFFYFNLEGVKTLSGFVFSLHGLTGIVNDIIDTTRQIVKRNSLSLDNMMLVYLVTYLIVISLLIAYLWDCYRHGLFTFAPESCNSVANNLYKSHTTIFTDRAG